MRKFPERLPTAWLHFIKLLFLPLCICQCIELCPSNATNAQLILTLAASVEALYLHLHRPLLPSKGVFEFVELGGDITCALITREKLQADLEVQVGTSSYHALCTYEYIRYVEVPGSPAPYV